MIGSVSSKDQKGWDTSKFGGHHPVAMPVVQDVEIRGLPGGERFASVLHSKLTALAFRDLPESLSTERIYFALLGLMVLRVRQCRGVRAPLPGLDRSEVVYPAFMFPVLRAIGDVRDLEDAVELRVVLSAELESEFTQPAWNEVLDTLRALHNHGLKNGLEFAEALPRETYGQVTVLAFVTVSDRLASHTAQKSHSDALIRSALDLRFADYIWGMPRWEYNNLEWYHGQLERVVHDSFRV